MSGSDVIVVGAGHNGLICAAYLARAGYDTLLVEARSSVGGCASTVEDLGARFNICNCDHTLIRGMPLIDELDLAGYGLDYLENDVSGVYAFYDDHQPWLFFHDLEATLESLRAALPSEVENFRRYVDDALPVASLVLEMARTTPTAGAIARRAMAQRSPSAARRLLDWSRLSLNDVLARYFDDWHVTMPLVSVGPTVWGVPPEAPGTGLAALGYASRLLVRTGRPRGGSGALPAAIRRSFEAAGGRVHCDGWVSELVVDDGAVTGVRLADGTRLDAGVVVAACDPQRVFIDWINDPPPSARKLVNRWRNRPVHDGYESKVDAVLSELPTHGGSQRLPGGLELLGPTTVVSPSPEQLMDAHRLRGEGSVGPAPTLLFNIPSALDDQMLSASGEHVLSLETLFTPYDLQGGWPDSTEPQRWLEVWADLMEPGALPKVDRWRVMTPDRYEREFAMHRGHTPAFAASPLSTLVGRQPELTRHRTPIDGLYLSGAATYPGAGIFGAAGRNTAAAVERDLTRDPRIRSLRRRLAGVGR